MTLTRGCGAIVTFDSIPAGSAVFLDANTLVYAFTADPRFSAACANLLRRIENKEFQAVTSAHVGEMAHRLITLEASSKLKRALAGLVNWLKRHPLEVQALSSNRNAIDELSILPITIHAVTRANVSQAVYISRAHGLLTNDALTVAIMNQHGLTRIASNDADFDRLPGFTRFTPS